ncbi:hypothetical protein [Bradyrhizobium sp. JYMT SZCCT0428]|uniref:hypothetical protein n=1 Tax=Bradyrhizobium sp. JYMT SZCCT0428 TaxID=2807673 RepID=UPI001BAD0F93|nr:hypothetical protein [Bradyrhizobium sp. JYMT SZCCT0428]MBR1153996.1 hypothetical protein [Bradyrhizobium sp. JYMT SZCCT0428]
MSRFISFGRGQKVLEQQARQDQPQRHGNNAVVPFTATLVSRTAGAPGPIETNSTRVLAVWNKKKPRIIETTAEKPSAANGRADGRRPA